MSTGDVTSLLDSLSFRPEEQFGLFQATSSHWTGRYSTTGKSAMPWITAAVTRRLVAILNIPQEGGALFEFPYDCLSILFTLSIRCFYVWALLIIIFRDNHGEINRSEILVIDLFIFLNIWVT